jgi:hypothetical protein
METQVATLTVGKGQQYSTISAAVKASHDGDVVQVQAGTYTNDFATINTKITLQAWAAWSTWWRLAISRTTRAS